jgi:hypothetical protein
MEEGKEISSEGVHEVCHNPCTVCNKRDILITRRYALYVQARVARIKSTVYQ